MKVTKVSYFILDRRSWSHPIARCTVILDNVLKLNGIKLYEGVNGKYITFPGRKSLDSDGKESELKEVQRHRNEVYHPVEKEFADYLKSVIIEGYTRILENNNFSYIPDEGKILNMELDNGKEDVEIP